MPYHPTAIIHQNARLEEDIEIGPYSIIGPHVVLKKKVKVHSHVVIEGCTNIGENTEIFPFASIGHRPQDLKFAGEKSTVHIGRSCIIREYVTIQPGTQKDKMSTVVGDHCLLMASAHVAHDCCVGNHVIMANNATLGGHVHVEDHVIIGGLAAVHQFVRIGAHAIIGGMSGVEQDVVPYGSVKGERSSLVGINITGLKRRGFKRSDIDILRDIYHAIFCNMTQNFVERINHVEAKYGHHPHTKKFFAFIKHPTDRGVCMPQDAYQNKCKSLV